MTSPKEEDSYFLRFDRATQSKFKKLSDDGDRLDREKKKLMARIRKLTPRFLDAKRDASFFARLHDLELEGIGLEERSAVLYLEATRLWKRQLQRKSATGKVPDAWAELDRLNYKRERIRQIERDIRLEQFDFWAKVGVCERRDGSGE